MTAKEEAKAFAEKCICEQIPFELRFRIPFGSDYYWAVIPTKYFEENWPLCVGIRLLFEA